MKISSWVYKQLCLCLRISYQLLCKYMSLKFVSLCKLYILVQGRWWIYTAKSFHVEWSESMERHVPELNSVYGQKWKTFSFIRNFSVKIWMFSYWKYFCKGVAGRGGLGDKSHQPSRKDFILLGFLLIFWNSSFTMKYILLLHIRLPPPRKKKSPYKFSTLPA